MAHPVFHHFPIVSVKSDGNFHIDFLGVKTRPKFWKNIKPAPVGEIKKTYPAPGEQYFEWITVLDSVLKAVNKFTMIELGSGYGIWIVRGAAALRRISDIPFYLIGVEGDETHFNFMKEHFLDNNINPGDHCLINAVVTKKDGFAFFSCAEDPSQDYGNNVIGDDKDINQVKKWLGLEGTHLNMDAKIIAHDNKKVVKTRSVSLTTILEPLEVIDLIHMDIQGEEYNVLQNSIIEVSQKVKTIIIGIHSDEIQNKLRKLMRNHDWLPRYDFPRRSRWNTYWGEIQFRDGCQVWLNRAAENIVPTECVKEML